MLAHVPSFGRNPRGSPDFLAYSVPKACMHVLGTRVPRRLGVARSASSPKAAQALGCSLTPGLRISFGRVTCMARAASVPGLWALGSLLLACVCGWVRVALGGGFCLPLPVVAGVLGGCVWARFVVLSLFCRLFVVFVVGLWCRPAFGTCVVSCAFPLPPAVSGFGVRCGRACWARVSAVPRPSWLGCRVVFFALFCFFFFPVAGCPCPGPCGLSPRLLSFGLGCWLFFFFSPCFGAPFPAGPLFLAWCCRFWLGRPPVPVWGSCLRCPLGGGFGPLLCCWRRFGGCGLFLRAPPPLFFFGGGGAWLFLPLPFLGWRLLCGWCVVWLVPRHSWRRFLCATPRHSWLGLAAGGGGRSPPLLAGVCRRRWCVAVVCWWGCGWCVLWLVPRHSWRRFLCATPRHSWLGFAAAGGGRSPPLLAGVCLRLWCVVCGGGVLVGLWLVCGVVGPSPLLAEVPVCYSPPLLAGFRCRWWWAVPATPGWGPLAAVVCGVWCVVCGVWCVAVVCWWGCSGVWCGWSLATPGGGSCVLLSATPGWVSLPVVVGGPRHSWLGSACGGGVWCVVCGVWCVVCGGGVLVGLFWCVVWLVPRHSWRRFLCATPRHSWLGFAAVGGGRSPPLLAGVRLRRWCVVCGVWRWCVGGVVAGVWCGWSLATPGGGSCVLLPATPGWVSLPLVVGGPRHSWLGSAGGVGLWCVAVVCCWGCGWCVVWLVPRHSWRRSLCATPRHSWLGFVAGGGGRSPPLLAGVRWRRWCVVCGVVCGVLLGFLATPGGGSCVLLPATPGWVSLPVVVGGPRHSWLGSAGGGGVRALLGRVGRAGLPGAFWCASPFPLAALSFCFAWFPQGWGCPSLFRCCCRSSLVVFLGLPLPGWRLVCVSRLAVGCSLVVAPPPPPTFVSGGFQRSCLWPLCFCLFFPSSSSSVRPRCLRLSLVSGPGCPGPRRLRCLFCWPAASRLSVRLSLFRAFRLAVGCSRVVAAPPPPLVSRGFRSCRSVLCAVLCCASLGAVLRRAAACCVARCCAVVCCVALVWCRCLLRRALWRCPSPWGPVLCGAVFCGVPPRCVLCAVCVLPWRGGACCCSPLCLVLCVSRGAVLCVPCALRSVRCCASLCWCARVVLFVWCVLLLAPGAVVRCCVLCCFLWCAVVRCWVWWPVVVCWWRVSVSVSLSGRVVCFPVVGVVCCGALLSCVVFCGAVLSRGAVLLCSAVVLRCCWGLLCPPVGRRAVLCCAVGWLCCFWPGGGVCVLWCSFPRAVRSLSSPLCALRCLVVLAVVPCFPVSCAVALCCRVVLCCRALLSFCGAVCVCFALLRPVVRRPCGLRCCWCLVLWRVPVRCGVSLGVLRCGGAALVCRGVLLCCALSCGVLRSVPCPAVPCCPAVLCWLAVLCGCLRCWCFFCPLFFC